ncbi:response regulator [Phreatobacter sp.]|uniref:PAS domain-containing hybrid sensor histidine kinase/response regulator n=1 Tax=Phreatobacter sp. TaxID=1966341 RepID=UPI0022C3E129|nr:response regulator [Phreatobacter sp.]MCZ8314502.1 response regulator [Phreatobacter sp.]
MALAEKTARADAAARAGGRRSVDRSDQAGSTAMVLVVAVVLVGAALFFLMIGRDNAYPYVIGLLATLAVCGVFSLFAYASGILRFATEDGRNDVTKAIAASAGEALVVSEPSGRVLYANPAYLAMTGATGEDDVRGVERAFTGAPEISEAIYRLSQAAREGRRHQEEVRRADGPEPRWLRLKVRPLSGEGAERVRGAARPSVWTVEDITRDRASAESAFETLQKAIDFLDHAPAGFFSMEPDGEIGYMNATLAGWLDHDLTEVGPGGLALADILAADAAALLRTVPAKPSDVTTATFDVDMKRRSGEALPVRLLHKVAFSADGAPGASRTLVINRGRGTDSGDSLRAAEVRFARFFNSSPLGIATVDRDGHVGRANPIFARMLAEVAPTTEVGPRSILSLVKESSRPLLIQAIGEAAAGKGDLAPVDAAFQGDGNRFCHFFVAPVDDPEQPGEAAIVYAVETTELRQLQEQFAQSQKMNAVGQLAGGVAHDFNNLLQAIIGHADLLLMDHKPADPSFNDVMQIKQNANRAASLVRQLLAFSRKQTLRPQVVQLGDVLSDISMLLRRSLGERVGLDMVHGRDLWPIRADVTQLEQVILNLAVNARDAMPEGGKLTIRTANVPAGEVARHRSKDDPVEMPETDSVMIEVTDTGTGIPDDIKQKIFDPFFSTKDVGKGTGLGLSTVYGIVKQSGGYIFVDSQVGRGTIFRIFLPRHVEGEEPVVVAPPVAPERTPAAPAAMLVSGGVEAPGAPSAASTEPVGAAEASAEPAEAAASPPAAPVLREETGPGTILLVEDEEAVRAFASRALISRGYTVLEAGSGVEALEVMAEHGGTVDLVVSDVVMPEMNGPTLLGELRKSNPGIKVIFVSGYAEEAFKNDLPEGQSFAFLPKPFSLKQLIEAVKEQVKV